MKKLKALFTAATIVTTILGAVEIALAVKEERNGDYSREFPDAQDEIKRVISEVREEQINE